MLVEHEGPGFFIAHARKNARRHFQHRHLDPKLRGRGRRFKPDEFGADYDQVTACAQRRGQGARVGFGAQIMHPRHAERQHRQFAYHASGREHQCVVAETPA